MEGGRLEDKKVRVVSTVLFWKLEKIVLILGKITNLWVKFPIYRSSQRRCSIRKGVLWTFAKFTGKHLCQSLFFNKIGGLWKGTVFWTSYVRSIYVLCLRGFYRTPPDDCFGFYYVVDSKILTSLTRSLEKRIWSILLWYQVDFVKQWQPFVIRSVSVTEYLANVKLQNI